MNRLDWWNVKDEHTPYQWTCQKLMQRVSPRGPQRDDLRAAFNTASLRCALSAGKVEVGEVRDVIEALVSYLECEQSADGIELDREALKRMNEGG